MILKHIPNILTLFRLIMIIPFLVFLNHNEFIYAFYTFILAGFTDGLDGWLARHFHWQSPFGSFMDPLADKLLVFSSFFALAMLGILPYWLVIVVFFRDLSILLGALIWCWYIQRKFDFLPSLLSKINTSVQLGLVTYCLFELAYFNFDPLLLDVFIFITAITTIASFFDYALVWGKKVWFRQQQH